jgi:hypothetical protein
MRLLAVEEFPPALCRACGAAGVGMSTLINGDVFRLIGGSVWI